MTKYLIAFIPAGRQAATDAKLATDRKVTAAPKAGTSNFSIPLSVTGSAPGTHYGCCWPIAESEPLAKDAAAFKSVIADATFHTVEADKFDRQTDWLDWLAGHGLRPVAAKTLKD
jgi:hypothetical protein